MFRVDPDSLLFLDLSDAEAEQLLLEAEASLFPSSGLPQLFPMFDQWFDLVGAAPHQRLMYLSAVFPARAFLSLLRRRSSSS